MTREEIGEKQDHAEQTNTWFQNRGFFSDYFLQVRLPPDSWHTSEGKRIVKPSYSVNNSPKSIVV